MAAQKSSKSRTTGIIILVTAALLIIGGLGYNYFEKRIVLSRPRMTGNKAGNLYNLGLFCESDDMIFFSNYMDDGMLYSMKSDLSGFKKLNKDYPRYINADENYIYYSRMNNLKEAGAESIFTFYANGVFRAKKNGKALTVLHNKPVGSVLVYNNMLYYQNYVKDGKVSMKRMNIDGTDDRDFLDDEVVICEEDAGRLYYTGFKDDHNIYSLSADNGSKRLELEASAYHPIVTEKGIFYIDTLDRYRLKLYSAGEIKTLVNDKISTYNITDDGNYVYYQVDGTDSDGLYLYDYVSDSTTLVREGNYKWLNMAAGYCFFYSADESLVFVHSPNSGLSYFNPPVLTK